jgi:predicted ATPase/DNA-binding CsgD family transcriptional regulator
VRAEQEFAVPPLTVPNPKRLPDLVTLSQYEAVALFIQRAQAVKPNFQITNATAPAVAEICVCLDGLPLAIELAAARIKLFPPHALLARLGQRLAMLPGGARDAPARQQTLRDTIEWSYRLLDTQEQQLFRRLSVFVGGCALQAVEAVYATLGDGDLAGQVVDGVASLIDKSLVQQTELEGEEPRLIVLETIREYSLEVLATTGELEATQQAHAEYYLALAERANSQLEGAEQISWLARLEREHENLRAALTWLLERARVEELSQAERALRLCAALHPFWGTRGYLREGWAFLEKALLVRAGVAALVQAKVLSAAVHYGLFLQGVERAEALGKESLALYRESGDTPGIADSLFLLGRIARLRDQYAKAHDLVQEALALYKGLNKTKDSCACLIDLALVFDLQGEYSQALTLLEESLVLARASSDRVLIAWAVFCLAFVRLRSQADPAQVHPLLEESLALFRMLEDQYHVAYGLATLGELRLVQGEVARARELFEESLATFREMGTWWEIAEVEINGLARVYTVQGDIASARALYQENLVAAVERDDKYRIAACLEGLANNVAQQGEIDWAARLWGAAKALREAIGAPMPLMYRADNEQAVARTRSQAGEEIFATAWAEGWFMTPEQALAAAGLSTPPPRAQREGADAEDTSPAYPNGLTHREVEVLRLLTTGMSNTQMAEHLVISGRTVNAHLRSIYTKLGVTTRTAATRFAYEHHLVPSDLPELT